MMTYVFDACSNIFGKSMPRRRHRGVLEKWQQTLIPRRCLHCSTPLRPFFYVRAVKIQFFTSQKQLNFTHLATLHLSLKVFFFGWRKKKM